jgi:hypothetical protein
VFERGAAANQDVVFFLQLRVVRLLQILLQALETLLDDAEVGQDHLVFHRAYVPRGIDRPRGMRYGRIAEHPYDVEQRVGVAERRDVQQRCGARAGARDPRDVGEFDCRRDVFTRLEQRREPVQPFIGDT